MASTSNQMVWRPQARTEQLRLALLNGLEFSTIDMQGLYRTMVHVDADVTCQADDVRDLVHLCDTLLPPNMEIMRVAPAAVVGQYYILFKRCS